MLVEQWFEPYGALKELHADEDVRIWTDAGWYKELLNALNVRVSTGVPCTLLTPSVRGRFVWWKPTYVC